MEHRVLIVDDEVGICWAVEHFLKRGGLTVTAVNTGTDALALLQKQSFAVVFVDAKLPDLDGSELATLIREKNPDTCIVLVSGYLDGESAVVTEGKRSRLFDHFLAKPFDLHEVRKIAGASLQSTREMSMRA